MRIRNTASLLGPAARGAVRLLMEIALATPKRIYVSAGLAALVAGIGANALLLQIGGHPAPVTYGPLPASTHTVEPAGTLEPVAPHVSATPISDYSIMSAAALPAAGESRTTQASAPDTTSSIEPAAQDKQHQSSTSSEPGSERRLGKHGKSKGDARRPGACGDGAGSSGGARAHPRIALVATDQPIGGRASTRLATPKTEAAVRRRASVSV